MLAVSIFVFAVLISSSRLQAAISGASASMFPAMYVFGDSLIDNGNNNYLNSLAKANYIPYGIDFNGGQPTGRFCNGKTIIDFLGDLLGLGLLPPFMETQTGGGGILRGVNYASAAGGILDESGRNLGDRFAFNQQVENFKRTIEQMKRVVGEQKVSEIVAKSLAVVALGHNDYINNYLQPTSTTRSLYNPSQYADLLIAAYTTQILRLYEAGLRKLLLAGVGPLGCMPSQLATGSAPPGQCISIVNDMVQMFNVRLRSLVDRLNANATAGTIFVYGNTFKAFTDILNQPGSYGFSVTDRACCGLGRNGAQVSCLPLLLPCFDRDRHVFWDAYHPTQALNRIIAAKAYNGSQSDCYPMNVSQMAQV